MLTPYLTDAEISDVCAPLQQPSAQRRYLERLGLKVAAKPNGKPLVARGEFDRVMIGRAPEAQNPQPTTSGPNRAALLQLFGARHGAKA
jgi:hypothetical protein